ncbi:MAG: plasmid pRiA4b ORF-3 family protein [Parachlamydiales bacterium]
MNTQGIYQFKISLLDIKPLIWRRILIEPENTLEDFHQAIQLSMGWEDYHLYSFNYEGQCFEFDGNVRPSSKLTGLKMKKGDEILYVYDFGDGWEHKIELETLIPRNKELFYPCCIDGKRSCPPEDSGGPFGYLEKLKILKNKKHPDHEEVVEWMGKDFDPEYFDLNEVNTDMRDVFVST